jgi:DNA-binding beta-propeller fold protein YncE
MLVCLLCSTSEIGRAGHPEYIGPTTSLRRPVALVLSDDGKWLFTANERSGSISVLDGVGRKTINEFPVGRKLADLSAAPGGSYLVTVDEEANELLLLDRRDAALRIVERLKVAATPVNVQVSSDSRRCSIASLWSRQVSVVELTPGTAGKRLALLRSIALPFSPRRQLWLPRSSKLVVADAFGGRIAVVDAAEGRLESLQPIPAHNIRGLCLSSDGKRLLIAHQILNPLGTSSFDDIHWGNLITNNLREITVADLLRPDTDLLRSSRLNHLGEVGHGAADPGAVVTTSTGRVLIALAGVDEVALRAELTVPWQRLAVGKRPAAMVLSPDQHWAYVANMLSDSVSIVDCLAGKTVDEVSLGPSPELTATDRGEILFHSGRMAHDGWLSCQSCHPEGHTTGLLNDNLTDGSFGTPKRILSLRGVGDTGPYAWNGGKPDLESQIQQSVASTMQGSTPGKQTVQDLAAYLQTLPPLPRAADLGCRVDLAAAERGQRVFESQSCGKCHVPPTYTSSRTYDVGLADEAGNRFFNPPSLRGVRHGGPFFHDGRASSLEQVFERYRHQLKSQLTKAELHDLAEFLQTL